MGAGYLNLNNKTGYEHGSDKNPCTEDCCLGNLGHCGRTGWEWWSHCEKRFNEGRLQRNTEELIGKSGK
jgi:hypothetical protein